MKNISDWLDQNANDDLNPDDVVAIEQEAEIIRAKAEAAGYSAVELDDACGGDVSTYLRSRLSVSSENIDGKMAGDASPIITPGFNQQ